MSKMQIILAQKLMSAGINGLVQLNCDTPLSVMIQGVCLLVLLA
jgi:hypothetical protein